ncbi:uncharacterized protein LOC141903848 [Tubulanus polymorphus]|uniref:uncharacterized protein LOC141903848 n=1 Tax=Tubulanus polymorphus TaxID=672921 RepID=UPI003DA560FA
MMATVDIADKPKHRNWADFCVKPTEAKPKHTLFGSNLEILSDAEQQKLREIDPNSYQEQPRQYRVRNLPPVLQAKIPDSSIVKFNKEQITKQKRVLNDIENDLQFLEKNTKYNPGLIQSNETPASSSGGTKKQPQWFTESDIKHTHDINILGVRPGGQKSNYNRDKYATKPQTHKYALIGDVLRPGNDFNERENSIFSDEKNNFDSNMYSTSYKKHFPEIETKNPEKPTETREFAIDLPANIQHTFGTTECQRLLTDTQSVDRSLKLIEQQERIRRRVIANRLQPKSIKPEIHPLYEVMGNALRMDHFTGHTFDNKLSSTKRAHTQSVFDRRVPQIDNYRMKRDELSTWAESNVLRDRMKKAWDEYLTDTLNAKKTTE